MEYLKNIIRFASQKLTVHVFPTSWLLSTSSDFRSCYTFLKSTESWSRSDTDQWQFNKIKETILSAFHNVPGYRSLEAVKEGVTGLLVQPGDVHGLADALCQLLLDPSKAKSMGLKGQALQRSKFSADAMGNACFKIYEACALKNSTLKS